MKLYVQIRAQDPLYGVFYVLKYIAVYEVSLIVLSLCSGRRGRGDLTIYCPFAYAIPAIFQVNIWFFHAQKGVKIILQ